MGGYDPGQAQPPQGGGSKTKYIVAGCGCCVLLVGAIVAAMLVFGIGVGGFVVGQTEPAAKVAREFLAKAGAGDVAGAHATFHAKLKEKVSEEQLEGMISSHPELFKAKDSTFSSRSIKDGVVRLQGTVVNEKGETKNCLFKAVEESPGSWKLIQFNITPEVISDKE